MITLLCSEASRKFLNGDVVFKVGDTGIVTTLEEYESKLFTYDSTSILHLQPLVYKIAYMYVFSDLRGQETIWYRELYTREWKKWFEVENFLT